MSDSYSSQSYSSYPSHSHSTTDDTNFSSSTQHTQHTFPYNPITPDSHLDPESQTSAMRIDLHNLHNGVTADYPDLNSMTATDDPLLDANITSEDPAQLRAIKTWTQRVTICFLAHMVTAICLLKSVYWLSTVCGCVILLAFYAYAHIMRIRRKNVSNLT